MKKYWLIWGAMYLICVICGFVPNPEGFAYVAFLLLSLGFFVPPAMVIYHGVSRKETAPLKMIRLLSILSLSLTFVMILLNFLAVKASAAWGMVLYWILILVSAPMICAPAWMIGLFGWACLLMTSNTFLKQKTGNG